MKYILMVVSIGIFLTACMSSYQTVKTPVDNYETVSNYSNSIENDSNQVSQMINHCLYGNCLCDKRLLELPRYLEYNFRNIYSYEHIKYIK